MKKFISSVLMISLIVITSNILTPQMTAAALLTGMSDTVSNLTASTVANHHIVFTATSGIAGGATLILTFDNGTSVPALLDFNDIDLKDNGTNVDLAAAPLGTTWGVVRTSSTVITFTNGSAAVLAGHTIDILIGTNATNGSTGTHQITNGAAGTTSLSMGGTLGDTGVLSMATITDGVVNITAEVLGDITFTISSNSVYFGILGTSFNCFASSTPTSTTCPVQTEAEAFNMSAGTNAPTGYTITVQGPTLTSGANTITSIGATNTVPAFGTEQFGMRLTETGGSGTVSSPYAAAGFAYDGITAPSTVASSASTSTLTTYSVRYLANIATTTEPGSYTASHTYVMTNNF